MEMAYGESNDHVLDDVWVISVPDSKSIMFLVTVED